MAERETSRVPEQLETGQGISSQLDDADAYLKALRMKAGQIQVRNLTRVNQEIELLEAERNSIEQQVQNPQQTEATAGEALQTDLQEAVDALLAKAKSILDRLSDSDEESE